MGCLKLTEYKKKLPRQWIVLCRKIKTTNPTLNYQFDYDNIGNRIFAKNNGTRTNYSTNELNQYTTENTFIPTYDADGNQTKIKTSMGEWIVTYNGENRPIKFTQGNKTIEMKYDYMGRRIQYISKTGNALNKDRRYMYNGYTLVQEMYNTNQVYMEFTWDPTAGTATKPLMLAFPTEGKNLFYFHDANKNVTEVAYMATHNGIGAHYEYDTFGNIITNTRNSLFNFDSNNINPFRFSSEYFDSELGLVYYNYRHYNPQSGRWLSRDPIAEKGGYNLYNFVLNNVLNNIDIQPPPPFDTRPDQIRCDLGKKSCCPAGHKSRPINDRGDWEYRTNEQNGKSVPNGCSNPLFTDFGITFFNEDCNKHDVCYDTCGSTQAYCDRIFGEEMLNRCFSIEDMEERGNCFIAANRFFMTVSFIGPILGNFEKSQDQFCKWAPCPEK